MRGKNEAHPRCIALLDLGQSLLLSSLLVSCLGIPNVREVGGDKTLRSEGVELFLLDTSCILEGMPWHSLSLPELSAWALHPTISWQTPAPQPLECDSLPFAWSSSSQTQSLQIFSNTQRRPWSTSKASVAIDTAREHSMIPSGQHLDPPWRMTLGCLNRERPADAFYSETLEGVSTR